MDLETVPHGHPSASSTPHAPPDMLKQPHPAPPMPYEIVVAARDEGEYARYSAFRLGVHAALFGYSASVAGVMLAEMKNFTASWGAAEKTAFQIAAVASAVSTGIGLITAGNGYFRESRRGKLSDICAKLGTIASTALLTIGLTCSGGGHVKCVAGISSAGVVASIMAALCAKDAISRLWGGLPGPKNQPPAAAAAAEQSVQLARLPI